MTPTSTTTLRNSHLSDAKLTKNDEFYTQWPDVQREMNAYREYNPDVFRGKVILLPCDDPEWSNFAKFFALHFVDYGIKKLISTSYAPNSNPAGEDYQPSLFETEAPQFDAAKTRVKGKKFVLEPKDINDDGVINIDDLQWEYLEGDGDFRSDEVTSLRDEADIVITNPPFSLFRAFVAWLVEADKSFAVIGTNGAISYKEIFPLIKANRVWVGATGNTTDMVFGMPKGMKAKEADRLKAERLGYPSDELRNYTRLGNSCWYTNLDHGRRHAPLQFMSMADNVKFSRHKEVRGIGYLEYDNFDAIEVPFVDAIPGDYEGVMAVPVSYLDKHNPDQFEVVGITRAWSGDATKVYPKQFQIDPNGQKSTVTKLNDSGAIKVDVAPPDKTYYMVGDETFIKMFARILIQRKMLPSED